MAIFLVTRLAGFRGEGAYCWFFGGVLSWKVSSVGTIQGSVPGIESVQFGLLSAKKSACSAVEHARSRAILGSKKEFQGCVGWDVSCIYIYIYIAISRNRTLKYPKIEYSIEVVLTQQYPGIG